MSEIDPKLSDAIGRRVDLLLRKGADPDAVLDALSWQTIVLAATLDRQERLRRVGAELIETAREVAARDAALEQAPPAGRG